MEFYIPRSDDPACVVCPVGGGGRDVNGEGARDGEPDDGEWFNLDLRVDLD